MKSLRRFIIFLIPIGGIISVVGTPLVAISASRVMFFFFTGPSTDEGTVLDVWLKFITDIKAVIPAFLSGAMSVGVVAPFGVPKVLSINEEQQRIEMGMMLGALSGFINFFMSALITLVVCSLGWCAWSVPWAGVIGFVMVTYLLAFPIGGFLSVIIGGLSGLAIGFAARHLDIITNQGKK